MVRSAYGYELILDLHGCDVSTFNRKSLDGYFEKLCKAIKMVKCERYFWDDVGVPKEEQQTSPHTKGTSAVQFILTSTIVIHTLELMEAAYIMIQNDARRLVVEVAGEVAGVIREQDLFFEMERILKEN